MARLGGVHEEGGRAGRGERRGDLGADMAALAHAGDDDAAGRRADQPERRLEGRAHLAAERGLERRQSVRRDAQRAERGTRFSD